MSVFSYETPFFAKRSAAESKFETSKDACSTGFANSISGLKTGIHVFAKSYHAPTKLKQALAFVFP